MPRSQLKRKKGYGEVHSFLYSRNLLGTTVSPKDTDKIVKTLIAKEERYSTMG